MQELAPTIVTEHLYQQRIHAASHGGITVINRLLVRLGIDNIENKSTRRTVRKKLLESGMPENPGPRAATVGLRTGKELRALKVQGCSTDGFAEIESESVVSTFEMKFSRSSRICRVCKKIESEHVKSCPQEPDPSHKNCGNRFRDAVGSVTNQRNSHFVQTTLKDLGKRFTPYFIYIDLCEEGGPNKHAVGDPKVHRPSHMEQVEAAGGKSIVFTHIPTDDDLDTIIERLLSGT